MPGTRDPEVADAILRVKLDYESKVFIFLDSIARVLDDHGFTTTGTTDMSDDNYRWSFATTDERGSVTDDSIDFTLEIAEAQDYGDEPADGINFGLTITEYNGRILGQFQPYNFTPEVWVSASDPEAIEDRWAMFDALDVREVIPLITDQAGI